MYARYYHTTEVTGATKTEYEKFLTDSKAIDFLSRTRNLVIDLRNVADEQGVLFDTPQKNSNPYLIHSTISEQTDTTIVPPKAQKQKKDAETNLSYSTPRSHSIYHHDDHGHRRETTLERIFDRDRAPEMRKSENLCENQDLKQQTSTPRLNKPPPLIFPPPEQNLQAYRQYERRSRDVSQNVRSYPQRWQMSYNSPCSALN